MWMLMISLLSPHKVASQEIPRGFQVTVKFIVKTIYLLSFLEKGSHFSHSHDIHEIRCRTWHCTMLLPYILQKTNKTILKGWSQISWTLYPKDMSGARLRHSMVLYRLLSVWVSKKPDTVTEDRKGSGLPKHIKKSAIRSSLLKLL